MTNEWTVSRSRQTTGKNILIKCLNADENRHHDGTEDDGKEGEKKEEKKEERMLYVRKKMKNSGHFI